MVEGITFYALYKSSAGSTGHKMQCPLPLASANYLE